MKTTIQERKSFISIRIQAGKEYKEKFGEIKNVKHFQSFMKKREKELSQ